MSNTTVNSEDLRNLIRRLDADAIQLFQGATNTCASRSHYEVAPEHLLLRMMDDTSGDVTKILNAFKIDRARVRRGLQQALDSFPTGHTAKPVVSARLIHLLSASAVLCEELGIDQIRPGLILYAIALNPQLTKLAELTPELERIDTDQLRDHFQEIVQMAPAAAGSAPQGRPGAAGAPADGSVLEQFCVDLTAKAAAGQIDPVFGRDAEIRQMIDIFARRRKNNPILVGEPGTGKTAIVEGLAVRIAEGDVPPSLRGVKLLSLDMGLLQAGAGVKGEFENRLKNVINAIKSSETPIITFIDEAHTLIGAGGQAGGGDASNLLKPALARGELRTVAATTWAEYKKYFEKDAALERRFQLVRCEEPSVDTTVVILRGLKDRYEKHHKVIMLDEAITEAARLSNRYISGRFLPDKAVDLLDTAAARVGVGLSTKPASLEDIDRELGHIETALDAMARDRATGMAIDEAGQREFEARKVALAADREKLEARWKAEQEAVQKVHDLRDQLPQFKKEKPSKDDGDGKSAAPVDEVALRKSIDEAIKALRKLQGEDALLHPHVDGAAVAAVVSDWTGVPVGRMVQDEVTSILEIEKRLSGRVVGQDHALAVIADKLRGSKSGLGNPDQPMGVFLCVGPSGVGKTELALAVSDLLFGGERTMCTINMSEFMEKHTVSQLKGSPPGYIGYGEGGVLTEAVRQRPYSVVLLDEVEKAHPDVMNLFYQVFDKGNLADGEGRVINFKNTVVFLTSNLGTDVIQSMCESGQPVTVDELREGIYPHLREHFKPALVARMTVIPFRTLGADVLKGIAKLKLAKLGKRLAASHRLNWKVDDVVYDAIVNQCTQVDLGARQIDHVIDRQIIPELSRLLLEQLAAERKSDTVQIGVKDDGAFSYTFSAAG